METSANRTALGVNSDTAQQVGARLRKARESIGRSTSALSAKIKVREHYLVAIEEGQWNELPPGLNGRGLIRIYARELSVSVPELDQAANQTVMPAEHDAQAPYQIGGAKRDVNLEREAANARLAADTNTPSVSLPRVSEVPSRTNTLTTSTRNLRSTDSVQAQRATGIPSPAHRAMEMTPEEEPLDVVTPDVASILGISLDMGDVQPPPQKTRPIAAAATLERAPEPLAVAAAVLGVEIPAPVQQPMQVAAPVQQPVQASAPAESQPDSHQHTTHQGKKNKKHGRGRQDRDTSSVQISETTIQSPVATVEAQAVQPVESELHADSQTIVQAVEPPLLPVEPEAASATAAPENSPGLSAAESYLLSHSQDSAQGESTEKAEQTSGSRGFKMAVGLLAACVLVLVGGRLLTQETAVTSTSDEAKSAGQETTATDSVAGANSSEATQTAPVEAASVTGENPAQAIPANVDQSATAADTNTQTPKSDSVPTSTSEKTSSPAGLPAVDPVASQPTAPVSPSVAAATNATGADEAALANTDESAATRPVNKLNVTGAVAAVLTLSEPLEIQVTADGQRVYAGRHEAGKIDIKFNKRAEIFVQDGSKAKLKYSGWEHGALGQAGRKRRIVLNADAFSSGRP
ncbi:MAG: hypothetical protein RLZZ488_1359 [Pseudomonadota bacterium]